MTELIKNNFWAIVIAFVTVIATYTLYGYRLDQVEKRVDNVEMRLSAVENSNTSTAIALAGIQKDIQYIKIQLDRVFPPLR